MLNVLSVFDLLYKGASWLMITFGALEGESEQNSCDKRHPLRFIALPNRHLSYAFDDGLIVRASRFTAFRVARHTGLEPCFDGRFSITDFVFSFGSALPGGFTYIVIRHQCALSACALWPSGKSEPIVATRCSSTSSKLWPVAARVAVLPLYCCQRRTATSMYWGSSSRARALRPLRSAATRMVPLPQNESSTRPPRREQSFIASTIMATGFTVGCIASSSSLPLRIVLRPA